MHQHRWKDEAACLDMEVNDFFENYEEDLEVRKNIDSICQSCPVRRICFATGVSNKEWGVWGGIFLENGDISREFGSHRKKQDWGHAWQALVNDK